MSKAALATVFVNLALASILLIRSTPRALPKPKTEFTRQAEFDEERNIYVSSNQGFLIKMADSEHCMEAIVADDQQTVGCMVRLESEEPPLSMELEIYRRAARGKRLDPERPFGSGISGKGVSR
jgi:hypothetical protein